MKKSKRVVVKSEVVAKCDAKKTARRKWKRKQQPEEKAEVSDDAEEVVDV